MISDRLPRVDRIAFNPGLWAEAPMGPDGWRVRGVCPVFFITLDNMTGARGLWKNANQTGRELQCERSTAPRLGSRLGRTSRYG